MAPTLGLQTTYTAGGTGASQSISQGASVAAGDLLVLTAQSSTVSGTASTAFTWPSGYVQLFALPFKDGSGVAKGLAGVAIKVADGTESGVSVSISRDGSTGTGTHFGLSMTKVSGAEQSTTPHAYQTNNPNQTNTVDWPSITTTVETSLLTILMTSDNVNAATPASWTTLLSGSNATGTDGGIDLDKREAVAAGTYDPANGSITNSNLTGYVAAQIAFAAPAGGGGQNVNATALASASSFGTVSVTTGGVNTSVSGLASSSSFGTPTVTPGGVSATPAGLDSASSFGTPSATQGGSNVTPTGLGSASSFGSVSTLQGNVDVVVSGLASASAFGSVEADQSKQVSGLASASAFGTVTYTVGNTNVAVTGLDSASQFGSLAASGGDGPTFNPAVHGGKHR